MKLSNQCITVFCMILQKGIAEGADITEEYRKLDLVDDPIFGLVVTNPPTINMSHVLEQAVESQEE